MEIRPPDVLRADEWELVKDLVFSCLPIEPAAQERWLDEHCPSLRIRDEVDRLLAAKPAPTFMDRSAPQWLLDEPRPAPTSIGRFRVERELGVGGMGVVYAAVDEGLGRPVALKVLQPDAVADDEHRKRLLWDARAASALNHPNIVCVYETGQADGVDYVAMELVPGRSLADRLAAGPLTQHDALAFAIQIASALEAAHAVGIVHRDLKPSNVMITDAGLAKLLDFGLAKSVSGSLGDKSAPPTIEGRFAGTVGYMSPEQAEGGNVDFRSDVFSFGSVLYELLTGKRAFGGESTVSVLAKIVRGDPPPAAPLLHVDPRINDLVARCLRKNRERRFQSMAEVRVRLEEIRDEPPSPDASATPTGASRLWGVGLAVFASLGTLLAVWILGRTAARTSQSASLSRLTWDGGLTTYPAVSRDGTLLAYASDRSGRGDLDIWVQRMGGSDPIRLTTDGADESTPAFSPDGTHIAYRSERAGGGVYVVPSLGGTERLLVPGCHDPKYGPDGRVIACWTGDPGGVFHPGSAQIWLVPAEGGPPRRFRPDFEASAFPLWMPNSNALVFLGRKAVTADRKSVIDWWVAADGTAGERATGALDRLKARDILPPVGAYWLRPEAWFDNGRAVLTTAVHGDATNIWSVAAASSGRWAEVATPLTLGASVQALPATVAGGERTDLVFASMSTEMQLRRIPLNASIPTAPQPLLPHLSQIGSPSISVDGRVLVFSARQPAGFRIVTVDMSTAEQRVVTSVKTSDFVRVVVSGDGRTLFYAGENHTAHRMRIDVGIPQPICQRCSWPTHVNMDGTKALFESARSDETLELWSDDRFRPLIASPDPKKRLQFTGRFSPDGRLVAFTAVTRGTAMREIVVVPFAPDRALANREWVSISEAPSSDREPYWSPDGRRIYFISERDGFRCLWMRPVDPQTGLPVGPASAVAHFHHAGELLRSLAPSSGSIGLTASSDALVFIVAESRGNLWWQRGVTDR